eukprot:scaffold79620_cov48-Phaeocystis_antarctica.AAC.2
MTSLRGSHDTHLFRFLFRLFGPFFPFPLSFLPLFRERRARAPPPPMPDPDRCPGEKQTGGDQGRDRPAAAARPALEHEH